ncbi:MAG: SOS response-associated peptidase [Alphaproteobacteria bacterium]|nr:SOS response-associated peptidase [Alphaproteobacteria bacterium]
MCNLYRMARTVDEIAHLFDAMPDRDANFGAEVCPGYPGLVVAQGSARAMTWGFPLVLKGRQGQPLKPKPVTNAREDKLTTPFWKASFKSRRCLVPVSAWAEAEGEKGRMTRTWYGLPGVEPFAVAGLWRPTAEWGEAYTMVMVDGSPLMAEVHDRMPLILAGEDKHRWMEGSPREALALCRTWTGPLEVERTDERWAAGGAPGQSSLL